MCSSILQVCFLCLKTRFSIFGPWGQICKLCKRTVCGKCYSKVMQFVCTTLHILMYIILIIHYATNATIFFCLQMRIPTEHFSHVPVVALSPTMLSPAEHQEYSLTNSILSRLNGSDDRGSLGSAPSSPKLSRLSPLPNARMSSSYHDGSTSEPQSLQHVSPVHSTPEKRLSILLLYNLTESQLYNMACSKIS